jgi:hypothetical protein
MQIDGAQCDPQSVPEALARVRDELCLDVGMCILCLGYTLGTRRELGLAAFTDAKHRDIVFSFDDPKYAFVILKLPTGRT